MAQLTIEILPGKLDFFLELIKNFKFIKIVKQFPSEIDADEIERKELLAKIEQMQRKALPILKRNGINSEEDIFESVS